jgi:hypothetical protein
VGKPYKSVSLQRSKSTLYFRTRVETIVPLITHHTVAKSYVLIDIKTDAENERMGKDDSLLGVAAAFLLGLVG